MRWHTITRYLIKQNNRGLCYCGPSNACLVAYETQLLYFIQVKVNLSLPAGKITSPIKCLALTSPPLKMEDKNLESLRNARNACCSKKEPYLSMLAPVLCF